MCKPNNSLTLQAKIENANNMLITLRLCALLALAQLVGKFCFFCFARFLFILLLHESQRLRFPL